ncbi:peptidyl-tRNA hydrolase [archaeon]|nr:peptidyl-tRNA hydrolase [archaeon]
MKQVILVRTDLKMDKGKLCVQCCHACVEAVLKSDRAAVKEWLASGGKKVILKVDSLRELLNYKKIAGNNGLATTLITDSAKTFFKEPTTTCLGIGPDEEEKVDKITGKLKML